MLLTCENKLKLGDLGLAKLMENITHASTYAGTKQYMSPEVYNDGRYYPNADIWYSNNLFVTAYILIIIIIVLKFFLF